MTGNYYKIDKGDPDLVVFEKNIGKKHPEFQKLIIDGQPSYMHPEFCQKTIDFEFLPGNDKEYCPIALDLFTKKVRDAYLKHFHITIEKAYGKKKDNSIVKMKEWLDDILNYYLDMHEDSNDKLGLQVKDMIITLHAATLRIWSISGISNLDKMTGEKLKFVISRCDEVAEIGDMLSELIFSAISNPFGDSRESQYAVFAKYILEFAERTMEEAITENAIIFMKLNGWEEIDGMPYSPIVILAHRLSIKCNVIYFEQKQSVKKEQVSPPATFIWTKLSGGQQGDVMKDLLRALYLKAWVFSYAEINNVRASDLARTISRDERFYYRVGMVKVNKDNKDNVYKDREHNLNGIFSEWNTYEGHEGFIRQKLLKIKEKKYSK